MSWRHCRPSSTASSSSTACRARPGLRPGVLVPVRSHRLPSVALGLLWVCPRAGGHPTPERERERERESGTRRGRPSQLLWGNSTSLGSQEEVILEHALVSTKCANFPQCCSLTGKKDNSRSREQRNKIVSRLDNGCHAHGSPSRADGVQAGSLFDSAQHAGTRRGAHW